MYNRCCLEGVEYIPDAKLGEEPLSLRFLDKVTSTNGHSDGLCNYCMMVELSCSLISIYDAKALLSLF